MDRGKWHKSSDGSRLDVIDSATENKLASVASATVEDAKAALDAANAVFRGWGGAAFSNRRRTRRNMMEKKTAFAPLGVVVYRDSSVGDELFCGCAEYLHLLGHRLGGVVQSNVYRSGRLKCDMYLRDLLTCERIEISNNRGNGANGCRLDGSALARACVLGSQALRANIDLFVLNKFGKEESEGRGFRTVIAEALIAGIPVVVGVSERNIASLTDFAGDAMELIPAERRAIVNWGREAIGRRRVLFATVVGAEL